MSLSLLSLSSALVFMLFMVAQGLSIYMSGMPTIDNLDERSMECHYSTPMVEYPVLKIGLVTT